MKHKYNNHKKTNFCAQGDRTPLERLHCLAGLKQIHTIMYVNAVYVAYDLALDYRTTLY